MVEEKIYEVKIVSIDHINEQAQKEVIGKVAQMAPKDRIGYKGFVKVTYVTASPPKIKSIEPIIGTINDYFEKVCTDCKTVSIF